MIVFSICCQAKEEKEHVVYQRIYKMRKIARHTHKLQLLPHTRRQELFNTLPPLPTHDLVDVEVDLPARARRKSPDWHNDDDGDSNGLPAFSLCPVPPASPAGLSATLLASQILDSRMCFGLSRNIQC